MSFSQEFLFEAAEILAALDAGAIERVADVLAQVRARGGRLYILGVGGSAGSASHAVADFRKLAGFDAYCPTDNVSELTARINDEGWETVFSAWLAAGRLQSADGLLVFSVGGGDQERNISANLVNALQYAARVGASITGIVGRDGGRTAQLAQACVIVPTVNPAHVTPHTEAFCGLIWHLLVTHPKLKQASAKWESETGRLLAKPA